MITSEHFRRACAATVLLASQIPSDKRVAMIMPIDGALYEAIRIRATQRDVEFRWLLGFLQSMMIALDEALDDEYKQLVLSG